MLDRRQTFGGNAERARLFEQDAGVDEVAGRQRGFGAQQEILAGARLEFRDLPFGFGTTRRFRADRQGLDKQGIGIGEALLRGGAQGVVEHLAFDVGQAFRRRAIARIKRQRIAERGDGAGIARLEHGAGGQALGRFGELRAQLRQPRDAQGQRRRTTVLNGVRVECGQHVFGDLGIAVVELLVGLREQGIQHRAAADARLAVAGIELEHVAEPAQRIVVLGREPAAFRDRVVRRGQPRVDLLALFGVEFSGHGHGLVLDHLGRRLLRLRGQLLHALGHGFDHRRRRPRPVDALQPREQPAPGHREREQGDAGDGTVQLALLHPFRHASGISAGRALRSSRARSTWILTWPAGSQTAPH